MYVYTEKQQHFTKFRTGTHIFNIGKGAGELGIYSVFKISVDAIILKILKY